MWIETNLVTKGSFARWALTWPGFTRQMNSVEIEIKKHTLDSKMLSNDSC